MNRGTMHCWYILKIACRRYTHLSLEGSVPKSVDVLIVQIYLIHYISSALPIGVLFYPTKSYSGRVKVIVYLQTDTQNIPVSNARMRYPQTATVPSVQTLATGWRLILWGQAGSSGQQAGGSHSAATPSLEQACPICAHTTQNTTHRAAQACTQAVHIHGHDY